MKDLVYSFDLEQNSFGLVTSFVQFGFIIGTLFFALFAITDRFKPSVVFFISAILAALFNLGVTYYQNTLSSILVFRFFTGFFLAGIYPVGMKIASDYFKKGLGKSLGYLVGALVLGTSLPHLLNGFSNDLPWKYVLYSTSALSCVGGLAILVFVPAGPHRKVQSNVRLTEVFNFFKNKPFRGAAFGYFGHMWELYAFWAFVPYVIEKFAINNSPLLMDQSLLSFIIIGLGAIACAISGHLSVKHGSKKTALIILSVSGICCLISPLVFNYGSATLFVSLMVIWGMAVVADSPLFSTLVALHSPPAYRGSALTIVNSIGFSVSIISIQLLIFLQEYISTNYLLIPLSLGPILAIAFLQKQNTGK